MGWCGLLNIDKPAGITSRAVVDHVQKLIRREKVGHAGTLDPLATGVLIVCVGAATRLITRVQESNKSYLAQFLLGKRSNTDDVEGEVTEGGDWSVVTEGSVRELLPEFTGKIWQMPPKFSALKVAGRRAYELARAGKPVNLQPRQVEVSSLELSRFEPPMIELTIDCGSGTYVRSLGRDIGDRLGCGAIMSSLVRTRIGDFELSRSVSLDQVTAESLPDLLLPPLAAVSRLPSYQIDQAANLRCRQGQPVTWSSAVSLIDRSELALVDADQNMIGIARLDAATNQLRPVLMLPPIESNSDRPSL